MADDEVDYDESGWGEGDSGPFCQRAGHWSEPPCEHPCNRCNHNCCQHGYGTEPDGAACEVEGCDCPAWKEDD